MMALKRRFMLNGHVRYKVNFSSDQWILVLKCNPITPIMISARHIILSSGIGSWNPMNPISEISATPRPAHMAQATLTSIFFRAMVKDTKLIPQNTNINIDGNVRVNPSDSFMHVVPHISNSIAGQGIDSPYSSSMFLDPVENLNVAVIPNTENYQQPPEPHKFSQNKIQQDRNVFCLLGLQVYRYGDFCRAFIC